MTIDSISNSKFPFAALIQFATFARHFPTHTAAKTLCYPSTIHRWDRIFHLFSRKSSSVQISSLAFHCSYSTIVPHHRGAAPSGLSTATLAPINEVLQFIQCRGPSHQRLPSRCAGDSCFWFPGTTEFKFIMLH